MRFDAVEIDRGQLFSNIARNLIGERTYDDLAGQTARPAALTVSGQLLNLIGSGFRIVFDGALKFGKFIVGAVLSLIPIDFSSLWDMIQEFAYEIVYFDWNQTDQEIKAEIEQNNLTIISQWGQLAGSTAVRMLGVAVSAGLSIKYPVVAGKVALALAQDTSDVLKSQFQQVIRSTTETALRNAALGSYIWIRKQIKGGATTKNEKPWTIAGAIEEKVSNIKSPAKRAFVSGAIDGAIDALVDIGYVVSFTLDDHYAAMRDASTNLQPIRRIEVFPDEDSDESIIIEDQQEAVQEQLNNYLANHQLVNNRDIGTVVGQPYDDWYTLTPQGRKLLLEFNGKEKPPFIDSNGDRTKRVQISIPDAKPGISWNDLKAIRPYTWGNYMARGVFENRRQMSVWGSSESEAKNTLLEFAKLSTKSLIQVSVSHPEIQNPSRKKKPTRVYPVAAVMLIRKATQGTNSTTLIDGQNRETARTRVELWRDDPPQSFSSFQ